MKLYHGSSEECFVPRFGLGNDERDRAAREKMNAIAYDVTLNPIVRTFSALLAETR